MPCFRGIDISFVSDSDQLPEYPHPDGSSVRLLELEQLRHPASPGLPLSPPSAVSNRDSIQLQKDSPRISVYIPAAPGSQFSVKYSLNHVPTSPCRYVFFKLYVNGRSITSWGVDPKVQSTGSVVRSLWQPSERWQDQIGIEGRSFLFMPGQERKSVAEDGGLVEIQVFRAKDRRPRAPRLEQFRGQEMYGIAAPSIGLLERPEDTTFYEWHLIDPKDSPYATFRFHYRSWDNLEQLNLIPPSELGLPLAASSATATKDPKDNKGTDHMAQQSQDLFSFGVDPLDGAVFLDDNSDEKQVPKDLSGRMTPRRLPLRPPPSLLPVSSFNQDFPQPSKAIRDRSAHHLQRPLPELPQGEAKASSTPSSETSETPSLSPSVMRDVNNGLFEDYAVEVGEPEVVQYTKLAEQPRGVQLGRKPSMTDVATPVSASDYEASPPSTISSHLSGVASPGGYLVTTGSLLEQHLRSATRSRIRGLSHETSPTTRRSLRESTGNSANRPRFGLRTLADSEWTRRTPSPVRRTAPGSLFSKMWSPRPQRKSAKEFFAGLRKDKVGSREFTDTSVGSGYGDENRPPDEETEVGTGR